jgi:hypothetical protein
MSRKNIDLKECDEAYVKVDVTDTGRNHKLESLVQGPTKFWRIQVTRSGYRLGM